MNSISCSKMARNTMKQFLFSIFKIKNNDNSKNRLIGYTVISYRMK